MAKQKSLELSEPILVDTFGLERNFKPIPLLDELLNATGELSEADASPLFECQAELIENADSWNEEELKMQFRTYYDQEISAVINEIMVTSKVDMMLSKGIGELIKTPYFFLHERSAARYKREKKYAGDPGGQMLGGMLIGQAKNIDNNPIYGCYV
jgi:hypothetical protein